MGEKEKVTTMVLKVDLQCHKCYKKVKKVLCKFPQIRDQTYDEKENHVEIKVVCCNPEEIRDKICCKGGNAIKCIKIIEPKKDEPGKPNKNEPGKPNEKEHKGDKHNPKGVCKLKCDCKRKCDDKPKCDGKPKCDCKCDCKRKCDCKCDCKPKCDCKCDDKPKCHDKPPDHVVPVCPPPKDHVVPVCPPSVRACCMDCCQGHAGGSCCCGYGCKKKNDCKPKDPAVLGNPMHVRACCMDCGCGKRPCNSGCGERPCNSGCGERPCYNGCGGGPVTCIVCVGYYGRPVYDSCGGGSWGYCEENPSACTVM